jgi:hypothetical protein
MDKILRSQKISKALNKINERFHLLTCEDLGRDWEGAGDPYKIKKSGQDTENSK